MSCRLITPRPLQRATGALAALTVGLLRVGSAEPQYDRDKPTAMDDGDLSEGLISAQFVPHRPLTAVSVL